ncbi:DUF2752 domain-containing protein [Nocardiopsis sp. CNT-189]|uniref:DUF2752 domain-containing protein n=1 Tax=Nocardiopsis oceanisediminis TaxID=2816862 RepID=UPI003B2BB96E
MDETANRTEPHPPQGAPAGPFPRTRALIGRVHPATWPLLLGAAGLAGTVMVHFVDPNEPGHYPTCPWLTVTGTWCPGCGTMRAVHALSNFDIAGALEMNVFLVAMVPYLLYHYATWLYGAFRPRTRPPRPWTRGRRILNAAWLWFLLVGIIAFWVLRNTPIGLFLAPGGEPAVSPLSG